MTDGQTFIDYYNVLQVEPNCDARALEIAYRYFAKMYHPDHTETADVSKLNKVIEAYRALRDPDRRAEYDIRYSSVTGFSFSSSNQEEAGQKTALADADIHAQILMILYKRRRESARDAGVGQYIFQEIFDLSYEHLEFHYWYLKEKGFIETTEQGTLAITIEGVDHVISTSRAAVKEKLLIAQLVKSGDE